MFCSVQTNRNAFFVRRLTQSAPNKMFTNVNGQVPVRASTAQRAEQANAVIMDNDVQHQSRPDGDGGVEKPISPRKRRANRQPSKLNLWRWLCARE